jgi:methyl-accepting chemotaxis protein
VKAQVGDVLGTVQVRSYLERKEVAWWTEVRLTAGALSLKILIHTVVLFFLLKARMEPLLALRGTVSGLARGVMDLSPRAAVNSADEFGELAQDLNHFLDRVVHIVGDLDKILSEVVTVGTRLGALNRELEKQLDGLRDSSLGSIGANAQRSLDTRLVAAHEGGALEAVLQTLDSLAQTGQLAADNPLLREQLQRVRLGFERVTQAVQVSAAPVVASEAQVAEYQAFGRSLREMALLEATMQTVAESGQRLLQRLSQGRKGPQAA